MKKGLTELVMILDRSGSMRGLEADTIGGFNSMIEKQRKEEDEAYVSVVLFDNECEAPYDRVDIDKVEPMTDRQYYVRGCTALYDAVGGAIHHIGNIHKYAREEDVPEKTIFCIMTDGLENASMRYTADQVRRMIERQKEKYHWEFIYFGANIGGGHGGSGKLHPGGLLCQMFPQGSENLVLQCSQPVLGGEYLGFQFFQFLGDVTLTVG